jgi:glyoxylase-like metal-dependent hydrolase (beta-lactamase superfamily II)
VITHPIQLADGLWRWTARHPQWHPGGFGSEVASFAVRDDGDRLILVDPLVTDDGAGAVLDLLDALADGDVAIVITVPYHARSAESLAERYGATVHGHRATAKRFSDKRHVTEEPAPGGVSAHAIGKPRRSERPVHLPSHRALAFGDAVVEVDGELRMWCQDPLDDRRVAWYRDVFAPTLRPLLDLDVDRVLVTHGEPVLHDGRAALRSALEQPPWYHHG